MGPREGITLMVVTISSVIAWLAIKAPAKRSVLSYLADLVILSIVGWLFQKVGSTEQKTLVVVEFVVLTAVAWTLQKLFLQPAYRRSKALAWLAACVLLAFALMFVTFLANFYLVGLVLEYSKISG